ncbi:MAG: hypothetical protein IJ087_09130 [Eggerthellaceae bacterium]|nr:hypothetical protein [Eggerthellaceae bacterium]
MAETITPQERMKRDRRLGIWYSIGSIVIVGLLLFFGSRYHWGQQFINAITGLPAIAQSVAAGKGIPLSNEESKAVLQEGYSILGDYNAQASAYAERFNAEYLADNETRERLYDDLEAQVEALTSSKCGLYWMKSDAQSVSEPYQATLSNLDQCRHDLYQYFNMLLEAMEVSLEYVEPFYQEEIDEMWAPISAANNEEGQNVYMLEFNELYPQSDPSKVKVR